LITRHAKVVVVRNEESRSFLLENGFDKAIVCPDAVLALSEDIKPAKNIDNVPIILLHIKYIYQNLDVLDVLLEEICRLKNYKTILVSDNRGSYYSHPQYDIVLERFNKKGIHYEIIAYSGVDDLIEIINKSTFVITTKLHVGITGAALNKRVFSIYKHPKTSRFHRQIGNIYCIPLSESGKNHQEMFRSFFESSTFSPSDELKQSALQNRKYLVSFLTSIK
jgi:polysaccharide pyruvyl transferase WcaK-like protein